MNENARSNEIAEKNINRYYFMTIDLLYLVILGVLGGVVSTIIIDPVVNLIKAVVPRGSPVPQLFGGHHVLWMVLAYGMVRKHGSPTIAAGIKGLLEFILGDPIGPWIIILNLVEGLSVEFGFLIAKAIKRNGVSTIWWLIAGGLGNAFQPPLFWLIRQKLFIFPWYFVVIASIFAFISGVFLAGLLGKLIIKMLNRAGFRSRYTTVKLKGIKNAKAK
ncbi:MAG: ECF transporter S component [Promethearchaeota archaeon]